MQRQSAHVLVDVILSLYPENAFQRNPDTYHQTMNLIIHFIKNPSKFQECVQTSIALTGTSQPIERLHDILTVGNEPIPFTNGDIDDTKDDSMRKKSRTWTTYEDNRLIAGIYRFGIDNWTSISRFVGNGRTRSQCSQRWQRGLDPHLSKDQWSVAEEAFLLQLVQYYGEKSWTQIAGKMGNRSDVQCRYRYKQMQKDRSLHVRSIAAANSMQYGPGVRKTQSSFLPHIMPAQPQQIQQLQQQQQQQQQQQLNLMNHQNQSQHQSPVQSPRLRNVQPQIFADDLYLNAPRQIMGNLRSSQSVPSIQFPPFPQFDQQNQPNNFRPSPSDNSQPQFNQICENPMPPMPQSLQAKYQQMKLMQQNQQMPPLPRQRGQPPIPPPPAPTPNVASGRPSNSDLFFDSFNDSFFDDNDFDASQAQQPKLQTQQPPQQMQAQLQLQPQIPQSQMQLQPQLQEQNKVPLLPQRSPMNLNQDQAIFPQNTMNEFQAPQQNIFPNSFPTINNNNNNNDINNNNSNTNNNNNSNNNNSNNNSNNNNANENNGLNNEDSLTFSLPTFDSDLFSIF